MGRLGIFGGTFDPPHLAHLILAAEAQSQLCLEQVLWVLTPDPPHKEDQRLTALAHRLDMLAAAIADNQSFRISRVDIDRPAPHYALDTVRLLAEVYPQDELIYLMGGDSLHDLPAWHNPQQFVEACDGIGVMRRPGDRVTLKNLEKTLPGLAKKVCFIEAPLLEISSSDIRSKASQGKPVRYYLPAPVYQIILERKLYQK
jgi:nicotinate-nucleotide adenylyltransferase